MSHEYYPRDNWDLASARAITVLKTLKNLGVNPPVISANGYADQVKIDRVEQKNRRIELRIIYAIPGLPPQGDR
jgi:flagellar motor protein MotB